MPRPRLPDVFRERNFVKYLAASTISALGNGVANVALAFAMLELGGVVELGIVLLAREIPVVVLVLLGGVFADRWKRRTILVSTDLIKAGSQGLTAALLLTGQADLVTVGALQAIFGFAQAFSRPATIGVVKQAVSNERLQEANALLHLSRSVTFIVGPAIGALLVAAGSPAIALGADAVSFVLSALLVISMRLPGVAPAVAQSVLRDLAGGWREFVQRRWAVAMVLSFGLFQLTYFPALNVLGPEVALNHFGGAAGWGLILSVQAIGAVAGGILALRIKVERPLVVGQLFVVPCGLLLAGLAMPAPLVVLAALGALVGIGFAVGNTLWETALQRNVPDHALSRISSFDWLGSIALNPLGYALIGPVAATLGTGQTLVGSAVLNVLAAVGVLLLPSVRAIRTSGSPVTQAELARAEETEIAPA